MTITNKQFRNAMKKAGLEHIQLERTDGYFWLWADDPETQDILGYLDSTSIYVYAFNHRSIEEWVSEIKEMWNEARALQEIELTEALNQYEEATREEEEEPTQVTANEAREALAQFAEAYGSDYVLMSLSKALSTDVLAETLNYIFQVEQITLGY